MGFEDFRVSRQPPPRKIAPVTIAKGGTGRNISMRRDVAERIGLLAGPGAKLQIGDKTDLGSFAIVPGDKRKLQDRGSGRVMVSISGILTAMEMFDAYESAPRFEERGKMLVVWPGVAREMPAVPEDAPEEEAEEAQADEPVDEEPTDESTEAAPE